MFEGPNSIKGLRKRAERLPDSPYKLLLQLTATQLESNKITNREVKKIIEYARTGDSTLLTVALKFLNLTPEQISISIQQLEKMQ